MKVSGSDRGKRRKDRPGARRNPFAGRRRTGAGPHSEAKYGKKDRRRLRKEAEEEQES